MGDMTHRFWKVASSWPAALASVLALSLLARTEMAAELHGRLDPVVTPLTVTSVTPTWRYISDEAPMMESSMIAGEAVILRECDRPTVTWELQGVTKTVGLHVEMGDDPQERRLGPSKWSTIIVGIPPDRLLHTRGYVTHECGILPVKSPFFIPATPEAVPDSIIEELGANAECQSGAYSTSTGSGTCSHHGGVLRWLPSEDNA